MTDIAYNFNRILRVRVWHVSGKEIKEEVIEFCPLADEMLNARIDTEIKYLPVVGKKNGKAGFSAKITIYNPPESLVGFVSTYATWMIDYATGNGTANAARYYSSRCLVSVEAGYWNKEKFPKDGRDYKLVFGPDAYLNSSAYYRKGVDNILELYCHNIKLTSDEMAHAIRTQKNTGAHKVVTLDDREIREDKVFGSTNKTMYQLIPEVVKKYGMQAIIPFAKEQEPKAKWGTDLFIIMPPSNTENPAQGMQWDYPLQVDLEKLLTPGLVINGKTIDTALQSVCDYFPGTLRYKIKYDNSVTMNKYYFWLPTGGALAPTKKAATSLTGKTVVIYDFQNMLQVPSVDGSGRFTMKMLFNPEIEPGCRVMLKWSGNSTAENGISPYTEGVATTAQLGQYYPSLQGGTMQAQVAALLKNNGYLFNVGYRVVYVTHRLSSHTNAWSTEVKTTSVIATV